MYWSLTFIHRKLTRHKMRNENLCLSSACRACRRPEGVDGVELTRAKATLAAVRAQLEAKLGVTRVIGFPALPSNNIYSMRNAINLVVLPVDGGVHLIVPDPGKAEYRAAIQAVLASAPIGITAEKVHFLNTGVLSPAGGEIHCGTNAIRSIPPTPTP